MKLRCIAIATPRRGNARSSGGRRRRPQRPGAGQPADRGIGPARACRSTAIRPTNSRPGPRYAGDEARIAGADPRFREGRKVDWAPAGALPTTYPRRPGVGARGRTPTATGIGFVAFSPSEYKTLLMAHTRAQISNALGRKAITVRTPPTGGPKPAARDSLNPPERGTFSGSNHASVDIR